MDIKATADRLCELCSARKFHDAMQELYADDARHVEAMEMPNWPRIIEGKPALLKMSERWSQVNQVHACACEPPQFNGDQFAVQMTIDVTIGEGPMQGQRTEMTETCLYTVNGAGKVSEARFFYPTH